MWSNVNCFICKGYERAGDDLGFLSPSVVEVLKPDFSPNNAFAKIRTNSV